MHFTAVLTSNCPLFLGGRVYFVKNPQYRLKPVPAKTGIEIFEIPVPGPGIENSIPNWKH
jgi:hypothetical protein